MSPSNRDPNHGTPVSDAHWCRVARDIDGEPGPLDHANSSFFGVLNRVSWVGVRHELSRRRAADSEKHDKEPRKAGVERDHFFAVSPFASRVRNLPRSRAISLNDSLRKSSSPPPNRPI